MQTWLSQYKSRVDNIGITVVLLCVALFAFFQNIFLLAIPFALLFAVLLFYNWKTAFWIMLFCVPASIQIWFFNDSLSTSLPDEPMMWAFLLLFLTLLARNPFIIPKWFWRNSLTLIIVLQYLWLIVTVIYSHEVFYSVKFLIAKTWFLVSFFIIPIFIFKEKKDWQRAFLLLLIPTTILTAIIIYKHSRIGFSFEKIQVALRYLFYNHVDYSTILSMVLPLLLVTFYLVKGRGLFLRLFFIGLIIFYLIAINFAFARAAFLAIVFSLTILIAIRWKLVNIIMPVFYALIITLVAFASYQNRFIDYRPDYTRTYMRTNFKDHLIATFRGQDLSSMERIYRWIAAVRMSTDEPLKGYGPNSFYNYYKPYTVTAFVTYVSRNPEKSTTHNYFLLMLVEQGIPAMILYGILVFAYFAQAQKVYHRFKDKFYKAVTMAIAMVFAASFINNFFSELIETHKVGALFYLSISLLIVLDYKSRIEQNKNELKRVAL